MNWLDFLSFFCNMRKLRFDSQCYAYANNTNNDCVFHNLQPQVTEDVFLSKYSNGPCVPSSGTLTSTPNTPPDDGEWQYIASRYANGPGFWTQVTHHDEIPPYIASKYAMGPIET